jgi:prepilin-type processing-associated H-X9-DG protein
LIAGLCAVLFVSILSWWIVRTAESGALAGNEIQAGLELQTIGQAIRIYAQDYGGQYPDSFRTLLLRENLSSECFASPARSETPAQGATTREVADDLDSGGHVSYVYLGRGLTTKTATLFAVIAYEMPDRGGGGNVLFGDGHVEYFDGSVLSKIIGRAATGEFPVTMPSQ